MQIAFHRKWLLAFGLFLTFLLTVFVAAYLRLIPTKHAYIPFYDTLGHLVLYGILALLLDLALERKQIYVALRGLPLAIAIPILLGIADELLQGLSPYRSSDLKDLAADIAGIVLFVVLSRLVRNQISTRL